MLDAALSLFSTKGYARSSVSEIARAAGLSKGAVYLYFPSKHDILLGLVRRAVGTAAACGFPIAIAGTIGFIWSGWREPGLPAGSSGYIYWPALVGIALTSIVFAHYGAMSAHRLPAATLKRAFGVVLILAGSLYLLWSGRKSEAPQALAA